MGSAMAMAGRPTMREGVLALTLGAAGMVLLRRSFAARAAVERQLAGALAERDRLRMEDRRHEVELVRRGGLIERLQRSRPAERGFNLELRTQLQREHAARW